MNRSFFGSSALLQMSPCRVARTPREGAGRSHTEDTETSSTSLSSKSLPTGAQLSFLCFRRL